MDELWEAAVCKILSLGGMENKPLCVINIDNYFEGTIIQIQRAHEESLLYGSCEEYFHVETNIESAFQWSLMEFNRLKELKLRRTEPTKSETEAWVQAEGGHSGTETDSTNKVFH